MEKITLAGGCFWCTEAIFKRLKGVSSVVSGYAGGNLESPTYEQVCSGNTGHAEAIQITFDPKIISLKTIFEVFFKLHDPTTLNRQGNDIGTQYRSAIFYHDENQEKTAKEAKEEIDKSGIYPKKIVTEITAFTNFYEAEGYHKNYYDRNSNAPYCQYVIDPKIKKLYKEFDNQAKPQG